MKLRSRGGLVAGLLALAAIAAPARATPFEATLSFSIESAIGSLGTMSFVGSGSGTSAADNVTVQSGIFAGAALAPVAGVASLSAVSIQVSGNRPGRFFQLDGPMGVSGALLLKGSLGGGPATLAAVPLHFTVHLSRSTARSRGLGVGYGIGRWDSPLYVNFDDWATRSAWAYASWGMTYGYHSCCGPAASRSSFYNYTTVEGSDARTPGGLGQVTLVTPIRIQTELPGTGSLLVVFAALTLNFVPEPGTFALCSIGVLALAVFGARRRRG